MKTPGIVLTAIIVIAFFFFPASAVSLEDIDTEDLDIPEIEAMDFSETPIGSLEALGAYADRLIEAAEEILDFIGSIFEMLGMGEDSNVENLMNVLEDGKDMTAK